ncbi:hypothetical protein L207DRAFT_573597 [Hyaloscypha variabilis F]|uniref:40S ribosomal protein S27 n=1 Tax=Hyaloscypha variabilis (strain UAMH 11265 / GT02V1 / F) TaxID=1149755 RepID=A0A2J6QW28_HYAVF|nr:hypothetical protein L207DRAFT_573597 [Hyaloscypha variabilis F]
MSVRGSGTRPMLDRIKVEGIATKRGQKRSRGDADEENGDNGLDLLNPTPAAEARKHKLKNLVPAPRSFFMDVKCPGCFTITTVFSHAQTVVICAGCSTVLCQPTGGKARLTEGCSFRRK